MTSREYYPYCGQTLFPFRAILAPGDKGCDWMDEGGRRFLTYRGRTAIRRIADLLSLASGDKVLLPSYNCGSEVDPLINAGTEPVIYRVDRRGNVDLEDVKHRIDDRVRALYVTHYFGFPQDLEALRDLCDKKDIYLIEDCALALFSSHGQLSLGSVGDFAIFSLPKSLPVPDGGLLIINNPLFARDNWPRSSAPQGEVFRNILPLIKASVLSAASDPSWKRYPFVPLKGFLQKKRDAVHGDSSIRTPGTRHPIPRDYYYAEALRDRNASGFTRRVFCSLEPESIISKRRRNYQLLLQALDPCFRHLVFHESLPEGVCPLVFPLLLDDREGIREDLEAHGIISWPWWKGYHTGLDWEAFPDSCWLKDHMLALPVHQDLSTQCVKHMAKTLNLVLPRHV